MPPPRVVRTAWMLTAFYAGFHFVMTHLPPGKMPSPHVPDKTLHFLSYALISGCFYVSLWLGGTSVRRAAWVVIVGTALFGTCDELLQAPIGRTPELADWIADVSAAVVVTACFSLVRLAMRKRGQPPVAPARAD